MFHLARASRSPFSLVIIYFFLRPTNLLAGFFNNCPFPEIARPLTFSIEWEQSKIAHFGTEISKLSGKKRLVATGKMMDLLILTDRINRERALSGGPPLARYYSEILRMKFGLDGQTTKSDKAIQGILGLSQTEYERALSGAVTEFDYLNPMKKDWEAALRSVDQGSPVYFSSQRNSSSVEGFMFRAGRGLNGLTSGTVHREKALALLEEMLNSLFPGNEGLTPVRREIVTRYFGLDGNPHLNKGELVKLLNSKAPVNELETADQRNSWLHRMVDDWITRFTSPRSGRDLEQLNLLADLFD